MEIGGGGGRMKKWKDWGEVREERIKRYQSGGRGIHSVR